MKNVFQIIGRQPKILTYDRWGTVFPDGKKLAAPIGPEGFNDILMAEYGTPTGQREWDGIMERMREVGEASQALTSMSLREDAGVLLTAAARYPLGFIKTLRYGQQVRSGKGRSGESRECAHGSTSTLTDDMSRSSQLTRPFSDIQSELSISDPFVKNWLDMLCFLLQGLPASGTQNAVIGYMLQDWYREGVCLDFPEGGSGAIVDCLVDSVTENGGEVRTSAHVEEVIFDADGKAEAVKVKGEVIKASEVVLNMPPMGIKEVLGDTAPKELRDYVDSLIPDATGETEELKSFIHLHAGISAEGLPTEASADFPAQWAVVRDWNAPEGVESKRNIVLVTMTSLIDKGMAPEGHHVIHAYVPATEDYADWAGMDRSSQEYKEKKAEAEDFLWRAVEEYVPGARDRAVEGTVQVGTPLTHERFLRRPQGSYGPRAVAGENSLPPHKAKGAEGLWFCGDYFFPGIGVPAAAAGGSIVANSIVDVGTHKGWLDKIRLPAPV